MLRIIPFQEALEETEAFSDANKKIFGKLERIVESRERESPLDVAAFDSMGARVWA